MQGGIGIAAITLHQFKAGDALRSRLHIFCVTYHNHQHIACLQHNTTRLSSVCPSDLHLSLAPPAPLLEYLPHFLGCLPIYQVLIQVAALVAVDLQVKAKSVVLCSSSGSSTSMTGTHCCRTQASHEHTFCSQTLENQCQSDRVCCMDRLNVCCMFAPAATR